ncbi:MAG: MarR family transcriptional regulator, partial [Synergistaceae bacterium]|nr:MarR family transcriptional regulator [Synergistaceae bacterium]
ISGTNGIAGAADTSLIWKRERRANYGTLEITGRDVEEKKYRITCENFDWFLSGEVEDEGEPEAAARPLSQSKLDTINYLAANPGQTPKEIANALGLNEQYDAIQKRLVRMAQDNLIRKTGSLYYVVEE